MTISLSAFTEYGGGGDALGARRTRRSFRYCVIACLLLSLLLWFSERYLRYELNETKYLMALTLEPESARAVLRQVVKSDAELHEKPTARYLAALAEREETDNVLPTYEKAYKAAPTDANITLRYGCRLFLAGKYKEARERFRESYLQTPANALPAYLEAAALYFTETDTPQKTDPTPALAIIAKTNSSGQLVLFPAPLWAQSLPKEGYWYTRLRREGVTDCCAPLYRFSDALILHARNDIHQKQIRSWDSWLETIEDMGKQIATGKTQGEKTVPGGTLQAAAGTQFQIAAVKERLGISEIRNGKPDDALHNTLDNLTRALNEINAFEQKRDEAIRVNRSRYTLPLKLCGKTILLSTFALLLFRGICRILRVRRAGMTLSHPATTRHILGWGTFFLFALLVLCGYLQHRQEAFMLPFIPYAWWTIVFGIGLFGIIYPFFRLPKATVAAAAHNVPITDKGEMKRIRRYRRDACLVLVARYYGIYVGLLLSGFALWALIYRILFTVYPWQLELLVTGMEQEELAILARLFGIN